MGILKSYLKPLLFCSHVTNFQHKSTFRTSVTTFTLQKSSNDRQQTHQSFVNERRAGARFTKYFTITLW